MAITIPRWSRPLLTFVYTASGWVIGEIPVALNILPATFTFSGTTYTTATLAAGLGFVLSGAVWLHSELGPLLKTGTTAAAAAPAATAPAGPQAISWTDLLSKENTAVSGTEGQILFTATNPVSKVQWYGIVDKTGHLVLTNIK